MDVNTTLLIIGIYLIIIALTSRTSGFWSNSFYKVFPFFGGAWLIVSYCRLIGIVSI